MVVKSADQITIVDVTDAYSVILTSEAYTFVGDTSGVASGASCTTQAVAFCGSNQCSNVTVDSSNVVCPTGISASVTNSGSAEVTIIFTTTTTISEACEATIPVSVDGITINKKFSFAVAKAGNDGTSGVDAITMIITSSNGTVFKNSSGSTVLTAHVLVGGVEQSITDAGVCGDLGTVKWYVGANPTSPAATGKTYTISATDVDNTALITAQLEK